MFLKSLKAFSVYFSQYQGQRDRPDTMCFLPDLYDRQSDVREVDNREIDEFNPPVTVTLSYNSSEFEAVDRGVLN